MVTNLCHWELFGQGRHFLLITIKGFKEKWKFQWERERREVSLALLERLRIAFVDYDGSLTSGQCVKSGKDGECLYDDYGYGGCGLKIGCPNKQY